MSQTQTVPAPVKQKRSIRDLLQTDSVRNQIALALPKHMTADRMTRVALTTINRTPKLLQCTPESLLGGLMLCSQVGLEPDGRHAHLIPYGDQCQVIFDYKGLIALARRNGVKNISADIVCENDEFEWYRTGEGLQFKHKLDWKKPRGAVYAAYCIWKDGDQFDGEVMQREEIEAIRKRSRAGNNGPWVTDWNEMGKKTVVRRASKRWPLDPEQAAAFNADDDTILPENRTSKPMFEAKPALFEVHQPDPEPEVVETSQHTDEGEGTDLGPQAEATKEALRPSANANMVKAIGTLLKHGGHKEPELIAYMHEQGLDETISSLEEAVMVAEPRVRAVYDRWKFVDADLKAAKEKKAA